MEARDSSVASPPYVPHGVCECARDSLLVVDKFDTTCRVDEFGGKGEIRSGAQTSRRSPDVQLEMGQGMVGFASLISSDMSHD